MDISVVICCMDVTNLQRLLQSLYNQRFKSTEILVVMDRDVSGLHFPFVKFIQNKGTGLSAARNTGIDAAIGDIVAFIDDDAYADTQWTAGLLDWFIKGADVVGGQVIPQYEGNKRLPDNLNWLIGCTDQSTTRPIGCNFAMRRELHFRFNESLGKRQGAWMIGEETDLIERMRERGYKIVYEPKSVVYHFVPERRMKLGYLLDRAYIEGYSKAKIDSKDTEKRYLMSYIKSLNLLTYGIVVATLFGYINGRIDRT